MHLQLSLDGVTMVAQMNANMQSGVIAVNVEHFGVTWCNTPGRLFIDLTHLSGM